MRHVIIIISIPMQEIVTKEGDGRLKNVGHIFTTYVHYIMC